jgi:hypothetical protein
MQVVTAFLERAHLGVGGWLWQQHWPKPRMSIKIGTHGQTHGQEHIVRFEVD